MIQLSYRDYNEMGNYFLMINVFTLSAFGLIERFRQSEENERALI